MKACGGYCCEMIRLCRQRIRCFKGIILIICVFLSLYSALLIRTTLTIRTSRQNLPMQTYHLLGDVHIHEHKEDSTFSQGGSTIYRNIKTDIVLRKTVINITGRDSHEISKNEAQYDNHLTRQESIYQNRKVPNKLIHKLNITMTTATKLYSEQRKSTKYDVSPVLHEISNNSELQNSSHLMQMVSSSKELQLHQPTAIVMNVSKEKALLYGNPDAIIAKRFLTIGIVSVRREGVSYLDDTITSIIDTTTKDDKRQIRVVIFIADQNNNFVIRRAKNIMATYKAYVENGFITIIKPDMNIYPNFSSVQLTLNDSKPRVEWRSKQNVDYAYIFLFCQTLSKYYLHLEDDVIAAPNFISEIKHFLKRQSMKAWFVLELSKIGFIGKLFKSRDLKQFAKYILRFFSDYPCDMLLNQYWHIKGQGRRFIKVPTLFQHHGVISSLKGKKQHIIDTLFKENYDMLSKRKTFHLLNPSAELYSTMYSMSNTSLKFAYGRNDKLYSVHNASVGDNITVHFHHPQNISRVYVETGIGKVKNYHLPKGDIYISQSKNATCRSVHLGTFIYGIFDTNITTTRIPTDISCLSIIVTKSVKNKVIFKEIAIFTADETNQ